jgi:alpha-mannosidase
MVSCGHGADTYSANISIDELLGSETRLKDKGRTRECMLLYGYGDGGGGPTEDMLKKMRILRDCDGLPKVTLCWCCFLDTL